MSLGSMIANCAWLTGWPTSVTGRLWAVCSCPLGGLGTCEKGLQPTSSVPEIVQVCLERKIEIRESKVVAVHHLLAPPMPSKTICLSAYPFAECCPLSPPPLGLSPPRDDVTLLLLSRGLGSGAKEKKGGG